MNIVELNKNEISIISGGGKESEQNEPKTLALGANIGQLVGAYMVPFFISLATSIVTGTGMQKKMDGVKYPKIAAAGTAIATAWQATSLGKALRVWIMGATSNLLFSCLGWVVSKII